MQKRIRTISIINCLSFPIATVTQIYVQINLINNLTEQQILKYNIFGKEKQSVINNKKRKLSAKKEKI